MEDRTIVALLAAAREALRLKITDNPGAPAREFSIAITAVEDAMMRTNRGVAMTTGQFYEADVEANGLG